MLFIIIGAFLYLNPIISEKEGYSFIEIPGYPYEGKDGAPMLPVIPLTNVKNVKFVDSTFVIINKPIFPVQKQFPVYQIPDNISFTPMNKNLYQEYTKLSSIEKVYKDEYIVRPIKIINDTTLLIYTKIDIEYKKIEKEEAKYELLIITPDDLKSAFLNFAEWKEKLGIRTKVMTLEDITKNMYGRDEAEKLRNGIKKVYSEDKFKFLLLAGDVELIPFRTAFAMDSKASSNPRDNLLPCDLYFGDLDGNWNYDGDDVFGEIEDSVDMYPEVMVGRAPVKNYQEAEWFCEKIKEYESASYTDYQRRLCFCGSFLWGFPKGTYGGDSKDKTIKECIPEGYTVDKIYDKMFKGFSDFTKSLDEGANFINQSGHGWIDLVSVGKDYANNESMDELKNKKFGIMYAVGCWTGAFDYDCVGEHFVKSNGGGVAYIGNSSYGWGAPGNAAFGYSDIIDRKFYYILFNDNFKHLGEVLSKTKEFFIPLSRDKNLFRWHQYEVNLLGDPSMKIYTDLPLDAEIVVKDTLTVNCFPVYVLHEGKPVSDVFVTLIKDDSLIETDTTDLTGRAECHIASPLTGELSIWVSGNNIKPKSKTVILGGDRPFLVVSEPKFVPRALKGETLHIHFKLINLGGKVAQDIKVKLQVESPDVSVLENEYNRIFLGGTDTTEVEAFKVVINKEIDEIPVTFTITTSNSTRWDKYLIPTDIAWVNIKSYNLNPAPINMQKGKLILTLENPGFGEIKNLKVYLYSRYFGEDPVYVDIPGKSYKNITFTLIPKENLEPGTEIPLSIKMENEDIKIKEVINLKMGEYEFYDDFEHGLGKWEIVRDSGGTWSLSQHRYASFSHSLYPGDTLTYTVKNNMCLVLKSQPIYLPFRPILSIKRYFEMPNYGSGGLYIIVEGETKIDTLDFMGAGGALTLPIFSDWHQMDYEIRGFTPGEQVRINLSFINYISEEYEGIYVDDVRLYSYYSPAGLEMEKEKIKVDVTYNNKYISIFINTSKIGDVNFEIFNILGQRVKFLKLKGKSSYTVMWDRKDKTGKKLSSGVYYIVISSKENKVIKKIVLME